jgi:hypothetical protein
MRVSKELAQEYFEILVKEQPETAARLLMQLFSNEITQTEFIVSTAEDIADIYY